MAPSDPALRALRPMLATSGPVPDGPGWAFEFRWDGLRSIAHVEKGRVRLFSADEREISSAYPELRILGERVDRAGVLLDGKIVALDGYGRPSIAALRGRMSEARPSEGLLARTPVAYYVFDVLHADGRSLLPRPYRQRRERLEQLGLVGGPVVVSPSFTDTIGSVMVDTATAYGLDGVVAKRLNSAYRPGRRSRSWVETTLRPHIDVLIGGWSPGSGAAAGSPGALLVGLPTERGLSFVGRVRSGLDAAARRELAGALRGLRTAACTFVGQLPHGAARDARWVRPGLVAEVSYRHWTEQGRLAYPGWSRLRPDVHPAAVRPAVVVGSGVPGAGLPGARVLGLGSPSGEGSGSGLDAGLDVGQDTGPDTAAAAELRALREQISPHFVYNALNTVASLVRTDPARARELLGEFADFTRYAFRSAELTPLGDELDAVAQYLTLEQARFGPRLRSELRVPPDARRVPVPFLTVQSLVVDAVRHGIELAPEGGSVLVCVEVGEADCTVTVIDDGVQRAEGAVQDVGERLRAAFGARAEIGVWRSAAGTTVTLRIPTG